MTKHGLLEFDGQVTHANQGGIFSVTLDNECRNAGEGP